MYRLRELGALLVLATMSLPAFADNNQKIVKLDSDLYDALDDLYLETGLAPPFQSEPYSVAELKSALDRVDRTKLSSTGRELYAYVQANLARQPSYVEPDGLQFESDPQLTVAGYVQTNPSASGAS